MLTSPMTVGNVSIEQHEYQRAEGVAHNEGEAGEGNGVKEGTLVEFKQGQGLYPAHPKDNTAYTAEATDLFYWGDYVYSGTAGNGLWNDDKLVGAMDKMVFVENTGKTDAYYRTVIAFECPEGMEYSEGSDKEFMMNVNGSSKYVWEKIGYTEIAGTRYLVMVATYQNALKPDQQAHPSLLQVVMTHNATNEDMELIGDTYEILVLSQACQVENLGNDAKTALDVAFGEVTVANVQEWFGGDEFTVPTVVEAKDSAALADAVANADGELTIVNLEKGEYTTNLKVEGGSDISIVGNGKDTVLSGQIATTASNEGTITLKNLTIKVDDSIVDSTGISQTGKSAIAIWGDQTVICENVTFDMSLADSTAITSWWDTGVGTSIIVRNCTFNCNGQRPIRATGNVTVENCTFNDPYRYAVQLTAKADTATKLDKATINFNNNTIVNGANGKDFVYGIQLEGETYGCNDCVINGAGNTIENGGTESAMYYCECGKVDHATIEWNVEVPAVHKN